MAIRRAEKHGLKVAVVGAGIVGASIAYHLSQRSAAVTVIDKSRPGSGASSHSFAWINATAKRPASYHDFNRRSLEMWSRFARDLDIDVGLRWGGQLEWAATTKAATLLEQKVITLQEWGYPCRMIDEPELWALEPGLAPGPVAGAALCPADGQVDPQRVVDACLLRASQVGATLQSGTKIIGLTKARLSGSQRRIEGVVTDQGEIQCDVLVLAAGVGTTDLAAMAGINIPQEHSPGVVINTGPLPPVLSTVSVLYTPEVDAGNPEIHLRQRTDGTVQIGEGTQESLKRDDSLEHAEDLLDRASQYLPALSETKPVPVPVGYRPMPLDGYPVLGFTEAAPNVYIALTHSGVTLAPLIGELAAIEIIDGVSVKTLRPYRPDRFSQTPISRS